MVLLTSFLVFVLLITSTNGESECRVRYGYLNGAPDTSQAGSVSPASVKQCCTECNNHQPCRCWQWTDQFGGWCQMSSQCTAKESTNAGDGAVFGSWDASRDFPYELNPGSYTIRGTSRRHERRRGLLQSATMNQTDVISATSPTTARKILQQAGKGGGTNPDQAQQQGNLQAQEAELDGFDFNTPSDALYGPEGPYADCGLSTNKDGCFDIGYIDNSKDVTECQGACVAKEGCQAWTWNYDRGDKRCHLCSSDQSIGTCGPNQCVSGPNQACGPKTFDDSSQNGGGTRPAPGAPSDSRFGAANGPYGSCNLDVSKSSCFDLGFVDLPNGSVEDCQKGCLDKAGCQAWTWLYTRGDKRCHLCSSADKTEGLCGPTVGRENECVSGTNSPVLSECQKPEDIPSDQCKQSAGLSMPAGGGQCQEVATNPNSTPESCCAACAVLSKAIDPEIRCKCYHLDASGMCYMNNCCDGIVQSADQTSIVGAVDSLPELLQGSPGLTTIPVSAQTFIDTAEPANRAALAEILGVAAGQPGSVQAQDFKSGFIDGLHLGAETVKVIGEIAPIVIGIGALLGR